MDIHISSCYVRIQNGLFLMNKGEGQGKGYRWGEEAAIKMKIAKQ